MAPPKAAGALGYGALLANAMTASAATAMVTITVPIAVSAPMRCRRVQVNTMVPPILHHRWSVGHRRISASMPRCGPAGLAALAAVTACLPLTAGFHLPQRAVLRSHWPARARPLLAGAGPPLPCTEASLLEVLELCRRENSDMFGCHERCARIGITGDVELVDIEGPFVTIGLSGRFWHRRRTVLQRVGSFVSQRIPEIAEITLAEPDMAEDFTYDEEGNLVEDKRSPDFNYDRETMARNGYDPDARGPFPDRNALSVFV